MFSKRITSFHTFIVLLPLDYCLDKLIIIGFPFSSIVAVYTCPLFIIPLLTSFPPAELVVALTLLSIFLFCIVPLLTNVLFSGISSSLVIRNSVHKFNVNISPK